MSQRCNKCHDARHGIPKVVDGASMSACSGDKSCMKSDGVMSVMVHEMSARNLVHEGDKGDYAWHGWKGELKTKAAINDGWVAQYKELTFYELLGIPEFRLTSSTPNQSNL
ncbi:hypothetical protein TB2_018618 [Malus domestica]